jgi:hypothetical protein
MAPAMTEPHIPAVYTIFLLTIEPLLALSGAYLSLFDPHRFITTFTHDPSPSTPLNSPTTRVIYQQVAALLVLFSWTEAVVLRAAGKNLSVWRAVVAGILLCDCLHLWASWEALGPQVFWDPTAWRWEDGVNLSLLWGPVVLRLCFLAGWGIREGRRAGPIGGRSKIVSKSR